MLYPAHKESRGGWDRGSGGGAEWTYEGNPRPNPALGATGSSPVILEACIAGAWNERIRFTDECGWYRRSQLLSLDCEGQEFFVFESKGG